MTGWIHTWGLHYELMRMPVSAEGKAAIEEILAGGREKETSFSLIFESEAQKLTHQLEYEGYHVWFTCVVGDTEYRLAARTEYVRDDAS